MYGVCTSVPVIHTPCRGFQRGVGRGGDPDDRGDRDGHRPGPEGALRLRQLLVQHERAPAAGHPRQRQARPQLRPQLRGQHHRARHGRIPQLRLAQPHGLHLPHAHPRLQHVVRERTVT